MPIRYVLGPPMKTVSENADTLTTINPTYELAYWRFGLRTALRAAKRLGIDANPKMVGSSRKTFAACGSGWLISHAGRDDRHLHQMELGASSPARRMGGSAGRWGRSADHAPTVKKVMEVWDFERAWGWDFGMAAMCAARVGEPELAIDALLLPVAKNRYHPNGHNYQPAPNLAAYLPGNGSLLDAVGMSVRWLDQRPGKTGAGISGQRKMGREV